MHPEFYPHHSEELIGRPVVLEFGSGLESGLWVPYFAGLGLGLGISVANPFVSPLSIDQ